MIEGYEGNAGILMALLIVLITVLMALFSVVSAIGILERCRVESGGVYYLISYVLGARVGGAVGVVYVFGNAVACALFATGFGESMTSLTGIDTAGAPWAARGIAVAVLAVLLVFNVAGVKWVVKLQLVLLLAILVAMLDLAVGSFVRAGGSAGGAAEPPAVVGWSRAAFRENAAPNYTEGESFFAVFGVVFSTATGVFAGINMSGDLRNPRRDIPAGSLAAIAVAASLYVGNVVVLGGTCARAALRDDYMIAERVAALKVPWLVGLYVSSLSSCLGALYGAPRILQSIAAEGTLPRVLARGRGANSIPVAALVVVVAAALVFVLAGRVNSLAPIVTMPFMATYACVDYAYFALAMTFDIQRRREERLGKAAAAAGGAGAAPPRAGSAGDLDRLFPERLENKGGDAAAAAAAALRPGVATFERRPWRRGAAAPPAAAAPRIERQPRSWYSLLCNRWVALAAAIAKVVLAFAVDWAYALACVAIVGALYIYIGRAAPGLTPGVAEFSFVAWARTGWRRCCRRHDDEDGEPYVVAPAHPGVATTAAQLTEDNDDFSARGRYHQKTVVKGQPFVDSD
ncbi:PREDICTED: solute carrier family 12 member 8-like [Priapulus caudatus]|uniref:Solute carrier family 12 member 8-like n=1 Tax=Priapulus caudatus TaxID=37621 RepID=A0ABM1ESC5_PRICU|nr:PREDICTED: solute carrier family 12 member 8-like [Priapulus caudatus]